MTKIEELLEQAFAAGAPRRGQITPRDHLQDLVDVVWHGDRETWESNRWVLRLNQVWLDEARAQLEAKS